MYNPIIKRLFDIAASLASIIVLSPLLMIIFVAIRIGDPGPAIFRQQRAGKDGQPFTLLKFRSMPVGTRTESSDRLGEVKITPVGQLIRRTNLDELPQLFNILGGDMSLVGPRPPLPNQTELIELRAANGALSCLPGLTGLAQISSYDGMTVPAKAQFDADYARKISLAGDFAIIFKTFGYLRKPPPTY
jgi:O-antigen biosynthesis protein WbqP